MNSPLKIIHDGCGGMAAAWLAPLRSLPDVELAGLVDINISAAEQRREEFAESAKVSANLEELAKEIAPDIVFNCTIPEAHHAVTLTAFAVGADVLSEKPLANSIEEARDLVKAAEDSGRLL